jgi:hypothetical protein
MYHTVLIKKTFMRSEISMAMKFQTVVFWVLSPLSLLGGYQHTSKMQEATYKNMWHHNPEDHNP